MRDIVKAGLSLMGGIAAAQVTDSAFKCVTGQAGKRVGFVTWAGEKVLEATIGFESACLTYYIFNRVDKVFRQSNDIIKEHVKEYVKTEEAEMEKDIPEEKTDE